MLVEDEFEDRELTGPLEALRAAGATVDARRADRRRGVQRQARRRRRDVRPRRRRGAASKDFDALVIPGGHAPDKMRMRHAMVDLARDAMEAGKPVAAICHGPQLLISANALRGRTLTCWPSIAIDVKNAGGLYVDKPVVEDGNLITSRKPDDVPVFSEAIIRALSRVRRHVITSTKSATSFVLRPRASDSRRRRRRHFLRPAAPQPRVRGGELDAVQQDHRLHVDPHQEDDDGRDRSVDAREARHVAHVPGEAFERALPQQPGDERADPDVAEPHLRVRHEVVDQPDDEDEQQRRGVADRRGCAAPASPGNCASTPANQLRADHLRRADQQQRDEQDQRRRRAASGTRTACASRSCAVFSTPQA